MKTTAVLNSEKNINYVDIDNKEISDRWNNIKRLYFPEDVQKLRGTIKIEYSLAKHLNEFIPSYLRKIAEKNVFYNVLKIGITKTKIHKKIPNKNLIKRTKLLPVKKMAKPKDIANYIYFLTSSQNQFITSEVINITGGE